MHDTDAQGWCTGMTLRAGMEREVGGGVQDDRQIKLEKKIVKNLNLIWYFLLRYLFLFEGFIRDL